METEKPKSAPILEIAWTRHAHLDSAASRRTKSFYGIRKWITWLAVAATFLAIITQLYFSDTATVMGIIVKILLVSTPVLASILASFTTKFYSNGAKLMNDMIEKPGRRMDPPAHLPSLPLMYGLVAEKCP